MWIVLSIVVFNIIIIVHESGHFFMAKLFGIKVLEFSLFFGPKIFSFKKGDTTYSLRMIPVLAYVKLEGEEEEIDSTNSFSSKPLWQRALVIFAGPASNILIALIIYIILFTASGYTTSEITLVDKNSSVYKSGITVGDSLLSYDGNAVYQPMDALLFMYANKGKTSEIEYRHNGEVKKGTVSPALIKGDRYLIGFYSDNTKAEDSNVIKGFSEISPALKAGLKAKDRIIKIDDKQISSYSDISKYMEKSSGKAMKMTVLRTVNNKEIQKTFNLTPYHQTDDDQYDLGLYFKYEKGDVISAVKQSFVNTYDMTRIGVFSIAWLFQGKVPINDMAGPVGTVALMSDAASQGTNIWDQIISLLSMGALVSIGLGVANLLPIPIADGGKLVLFGIEAIRRKPISKKVEIYINMVGFFIIICLFAFVMYNDIARILTGG